MGFSISWIAFKDIGKAKALELVKLVDTGEPDEANESPISGAELPNGWYVIFFNDVAHPMSASRFFAPLSNSCPILGCQVEEHVMASSSYLCADGKKVWDVTHEASNGIYDLQVQGDVPPAFESIRTNLLRAQTDDGGDDADVDHVFDIPIELASSICGYRHDRVEFEWGCPAFTTLVASNS